MRLLYCTSHFARWPRTRVSIGIRMYAKGSLTTASSKPHTIDPQDKTKTRASRIPIKMPDLTPEPDLPNPFESPEELNWNTSDKVKMRSSFFIGHHLRVYSPKQAQTAVALFKYQNRELLKDATHGTIFAWRTGVPEGSYDEPEPSRGVYKKQKNKKKTTSDTTVVLAYRDVRHGVYDCGERGSGEDLMRRCIKRYDLYNIILIVVRWKKGGDLGPSRFKCIGDAGTNSLVKGGLLKPESSE